MDEEEIWEIYEEGYEEWVGFEGCTCEHEPEDHGWGTCDVEGCPCEGGYCE